jgi:hypothetical protein
MVRSKDPEYPAWICHSCGETYGTWYKRGSYVGPPHHCATFHKELVKCVKQKMHLSPNLGTMDICVQIGGVP